jgi:hypothetical protein
MGCGRSQFATPFGSIWSIEHTATYICRSGTFARLSVASNLSLAEYVFEDHSDRLLQALLQNMCSLQSMWSYNRLPMWLEAVNINRRKQEWIGCPSQQNRFPKLPKQDLVINCVRMTRQWMWQSLAPWHQSKHTFGFVPKFWIPPNDDKHW